MTLFGCFLSASHVGVVPFQESGPCCTERQVQRIASLGYNASQAMQLDKITVFVLAAITPLKTFFNLVVKIQNH